MTNSNSPDKWRGRIFRYAPLFLWVAVIFFLSSTQGAMSNTSRFVRPLLEWLFPGAPIETLAVYHGYVRKFAHFAEYFVLGALAARVFLGAASEFRRKFWYLFAFLTVVLVAALDETNQSFNAARTGSIYDVLLDASGGITAICLWAIYLRLKK